MILLGLCLVPADRLLLAFFFLPVLQLPAVKERRYMVDRTARYVAKDGQPFEQVCVPYGTML